MSQTWSTLNATRSGQFAYWRELICEAFLDLTPESELSDGFVGIVTQWPLGALNLARIDSQRQRVHRTANDIARAPRGGYYANLQVHGVSRMSQHGRTTILSPGDVALVYTDEPFEFEFGANFRQLSLYVPSHLVERDLPGSPPTATRVDTTSGVGAAIRHAMVALTGSAPGAPLAADTAARLARHTGGLLAIALEPAVTAPDAGVPGPPARTRARLLRAALADIDEHIAEVDLSPATTARRLGISVRRLHALFAGHERSYAGTVRWRRLDVAARNLRDPALAHRRIADVAIRAGFSDVSSFHRAFRREFGQTPAEIRAASAGPPIATGAAGASTRAGATGQ